MQEGESLIKLQGGELLVPKIEIKDITTIVRATKGLNDLKLKVWGEPYYKEQEAALEETVNSSIERVIRRGLFSYFMPREYDYLNVDSASTKFHKIRDTLIEKYTPPEVCEIYEMGKSEIEDIFVEGLRKIEEVDNIFLKYFFPTPVNNADWERFLKEIVPVTEGFSVLFLSKTSVRPFEKTTYERGHSTAENLQIAPTVLNEKHIDFYVDKILKVASDYNAEIQRISQMLLKFEKEGAQIPDYLQTDIDIFNFSLENLRKKNYQIAGLYALQLNTSILRIKPELERIAGLLYTSVERFMHGRDSCPSLRESLKKRGFKIKEGYVVYDTPTTAWRRV